MGRNRQLQQCASAAEPAAVDTRAGGILCEAALGGGYVPVDFPAAGAVVAPPAVLNESHNVLHRITEEDADLMGKFGGKAQSSGKLFQKRAGPGGRGIAALLKKAPDLRPVQAAVQRLLPVEIQKVASGALAVLQYAEANAERAKAAVRRLDFRQQVQAGSRMVAEQIGKFDSGKGWRAVCDQRFLKLQGNSASFCGTGSGDCGSSSAAAGK